MTDYIEQFNEHTANLDSKAKLETLIDEMLDDKKSIQGYAISIDDDNMPIRFKDRLLLRWLPTAGGLQLALHRQYGMSGMKSGGAYCNPFAGIDRERFKRTATLFLMEMQSGAVKASRGEATMPERIKIEFYNGK